MRPQEYKKILIMLINHNIHKNFNDNYLDYSLIRLVFEVNKLKLR